MLGPWFHVGLCVFCEVHGDLGWIHRRKSCVVIKADLSLSQQDECVFDLGDGIHVRVVCVRNTPLAYRSYSITTVHKDKSPLAPYCIYFSTSTDSGIFSGTIRIWLQNFVWTAIFGHCLNIWLNFATTDPEWWACWIICCAMYSLSRVKGDVAKRTLIEIRVELMAIIIMLLLGWIPSFIALRLRLLLGEECSQMRYD